MASQAATLEATVVDEPQVNGTRARLWGALIGLVLITVMLIGGFELLYRGKVYPGVSADGVYLSGLSQTAAGAKLAAATAAFSANTLPVSYGTTTLSIPLKDLSLSYDPSAVARAMSFGRQGGMLTRLHAQLRALVGRATPISAVSYDESHLLPYVGQVIDDVATPVQNASLSFTDNKAQVAPAKSGQRVDIGSLITGITERLDTTDTTPVAVPIYHLAPDISTASLTAAAAQADRYVSAPLSLSVNGAAKTIDQTTIISWLAVTPASSANAWLPTFYPDVAPGEVTIGLNAAAVKAYVATLASQTDQDAQDAALNIVNGQATIFQESHNGYSLDQPAAVSAITAAVANPAGPARQLTLKVDVTKPNVTQDSLSTLGLTDLLSEGSTYFPGSTSARLQNVRVGAAKFNGVLLAPGEQFSFGKILGEVDASTGYVPELVILGNHEEKQYGGGLCQVATTAYRAALLAGLPIDERVNHSFAISYYTWPYGVPGVDATIYYPDVDLKFTNDTGHYLLIQTIFSGTSLKFDFYGTKTKTGQIRGPFFTSGTNDATQPSTTVFYRDVLDLAGNVIKTNTITTHYQPSTDFPVVKQFN